MTNVFKHGHQIYFTMIMYRIFKEVFEFEPYLTLLPERIIFTQFMLGNTKLPIATGRWFNIDRNERYWTLCNRN